MTDQRISTDFYEVQPTPTGALDFYALTGERIISGMPLFRASYFVNREYRKLTGDVVAFPTVQESSDTVLVTSVQNLGILTATFRFTLLRHSPIVECRLSLDYRNYIDSVFFETIEAQFPVDSAWVMMRDQRLVSARRPAEYVIDRWTTRAAQFGVGPAAVTFPGEDNVTALRLKHDSDRWLLTFDLDRDMEHPFFRNWYSELSGISYDTLANTLRSSGTAEFPLSVRGRRKAADCQEGATAFRVPVGSGHDRSTPTAKDRSLPRPSPTAHRKWTHPCPAGAFWATA